VNPLLTTVATEVAGEFGSKLSAILSPSRGHAEDARSRAIAMAAYRAVSPRKLNFTELGKVFDRDRTTVRHALARFDDFMCAGDFRKRYVAVLERIKARQ
jgi:hypothetical protein